jgi:hypothetical protein
MTRYQVIIRLKDPVAARPFFPKVAPKDHLTPESEPPARETPHPGAGASQAA